MGDIRDYLPETEILAQLAEEAAELAQAALKLRRVLDGKNPTPVTEQDARYDLIEEYGDVVNCCRELMIYPIEGLMEKKRNRWFERLEERAVEGEGRPVESN